MSTAVLEHSVRVAHHRRLTHCPDCGRLSYENEDACQCGGDEKPYPVSRYGEIYSYTKVHHGAAPFVLALVRLAGGQLVTGRLLGIDREPKIGLPVELADTEQSSSSGSNGISFCLRSAKAVA
ncbi:MAG TPA: OB-fold domain-containing protein [Pirellulales bacterium]|nr:OB-fold domain-containing protein [Pirellulales bacterium]